MEDVFSNYISPEDAFNKHSLKLSDLLDLVTEEEIYSLLFTNYIPEEGDRVISPFREDNNPNCYFIRRETDNKFVLKDWAYPEYSNLDCFEAVKVYFGLTTYTEVIHKVYDSLIAHKGVIPHKRGRAREKKGSTPHSSRLNILFFPRPFSTVDKIFWSKYGISSKNLLEDNIQAVRRYVWQKGDRVREVECYGATYVDTFYPSKNVKIYSPYKEKGKKFFTNCSQNDIGGINSLNEEYSTLIITKSYKDYRVIKNTGVKADVVYFASETMYPKQEYLTFLKNYQKVIILFDNDKAGIKGTSKLYLHLLGLNYPIQIETTLLPFYEGCKDISDIFLLQGPKVVNEIINSLI